MSRLLADHLDEIGIPKHKQSQYQYAVILNELLESARGNKASHFSSIQMAEEESFHSAVSVVHDLLSACSKRKSDSFVHIFNPEQYKCIWRHRDLRKAFAEGIDSIEACPPPDVFTLVTKRYLERELHSATLEWVLVDAIVASEIYWLGEEIKRDPSEFTRSFSWNPFGRDMDEISDYNAARGNAGKLFWIRLRRPLVGNLILAFYFFVISLGVAIWADINDLHELRDATALIVGLAAVFALFCMARWLWRIIRALLRIEPEGEMKPALELWRNMLAAYGELEGGIATNPRRVRNALARVVRGGAGWNVNVFPLLDKAIRWSSNSRS